MIRLAIMLLVLGGVLAYAGGGALRTATVAKDLPQPITCAELGENGPGGNAHVIMRDFFLSYVNYVEQPTSEPNAPPVVWLAAVPLQSEHHLAVLQQVNPEDGKLVGAAPTPRSIGVIVKSDKLADLDAIKALSRQATIEGLVVNELEPVDARALAALRETFPGADFDRVWFLEHGRRPPSAVRAYIMLGAGVGLVLLALGLAATVAVSREADAS